MNTASAPGQPGNAPRNPGSGASAVLRGIVLAALAVLAGAAAAEVSRGYAHVDDVELYYEDRGAGTPLLLLHGGFGHTGSWQHQAAAFAAGGYRVIAVDSRGQGRSTLGENALGYARMADDVLGVMDDLGLERAHIVGWSDGGNIGIEIAMRHPERLRKLVAFGANYRVDGVREDVGESPRFAAYLEQAQRDYTALSPQPERWDQLVTRISAMWASEPNHADAALRAIAVPVLVLHGETEEAIVDTHAATLAELIPGARFVTLPGTGHFALWEQPAAFNRVVLDFLRD